MKKENISYNYSMFKKHFSEETGVKDNDKIVVLMAKLKRAEGRLKRVYMDTEKGYEENEERERQLRSRVCDLLKRYKTVHVTFNNEPEGGIIQLLFRKTEKDKTVNW